MMAPPKSSTGLNPDISNDMILWMSRLLVGGVRIQENCSLSRSADGKEVDSMRVNAVAIRKFRKIWSRVCVGL